MSGAATGVIVYDPLGRVRSYTAGGATLKFLYDGDRLIAEYNGATVLRRYVHGGGVDEPLVWYEGADASSPRWLIADRLGSIIATTNASGSATTLGYGPYGEPSAWSGTGGALLSRFRYTGQAALPELQLYHYKARAYDPRLGQFLQTDPILNAGGLNLYAYVGNDPVNGRDPWGRCGFFAPECLGAFFGALGAGVSQFEKHGFFVWNYDLGKIVLGGIIGAATARVARGWTGFFVQPRWGEKVSEKIKDFLSAVSGAATGGIYDRLAEPSPNTKPESSVGVGVALPEQSARNINFPTASLQWPFHTRYNRRTTTVGGQAGRTPWTAPRLPPVTPVVDPDWPILPTVPDARPSEPIPPFVRPRQSRPAPVPNTTPW